MLLSEFLINDYSKFGWIIFDPDAKKVRHDTIFPQEMQKAFGLGAELVNGAWQPT